jgi:hypothetical protein
VKPELGKNAECPIRRQAEKEERQPNPSDHDAGLCHATSLLDTCGLVSLQRQVPANAIDSTREARAQLFVAPILCGNGVDMTGWMTGRKHAGHLQGMSSPARPPRFPPRPPALRVSMKPPRWVSPVTASFCGFTQTNP